MSDVRIVLKDGSVLEGSQLTTGAGKVCLWEPTLRWVTKGEVERIETAPIPPLKDSDDR